MSSITDIISGISYLLIAFVDNGQQSADSHQRYRPLDRQGGLQPRDAGDIQQYRVNGDNEP